MELKELLAALPLALREKQIVKPDGLLPISRAHWWRGVKEGRYPQPAIQTGRLTMWRTVDVLALLEGKPDHDKNIRLAPPTQNEPPPSNLVTSATPKTKQKAISSLKEQARPPNSPFLKNNE